MPLKISHRVKKVLRKDAPYELGTRLFHSDPNKGKFWGELVYYADGGLSRVKYDDDETPDEYFNDKELAKA